jgi:hypothetical protein
MRAYAAVSLQYEYMKSRGQVYAFSLVLTFHTVREP